MASILIADDDPHILLALRFLMERAGHEVSTAQDGVAAIAEATAWRPDLILLDVMMPKRDGYDVCRTLRADPRLTGLQIVMLTAKGREGDRVRGREAGVDAYVAKPFAIADVTDCVARLLAEPAMR